MRALFNQNLNLISKGLPIMSVFKLRSCNISSTHDVTINGVKKLALLQVL